MMNDPWAVTRLGVEIERLLPCAQSETLDSRRRLIFARHLAGKIAELEAAGGSPEQVATFEETMLKSVVEKLPKKKEKKKTVSKKESIEPPPATPRKVEKKEASLSLQHELERLAAQLKVSSQAMNDKLVGQSKIFDRLDQATVSNEASVVRERETLEARTKAKSRAFFKNLLSLFFVALTFAFTYLFISAFPK